MASYPEMVGAAGSDPADPSTPGLLYGHAHGEVAHHGPQGVVALYQSSGGRLSYNARLGIGITDLRERMLDTMMDISKYQNVTLDLISAT